MSVWIKHRGNEPPGTATARAGIVARFFFLSAALGFFIGLFEAYLLWTRPRVIPLLVPDVGYVIWFLAPLVDMIFFGLVGLALGLVARVTRGREVLVAIQTGITVTFVVLILAWFHIEIGLHPFRFDMEVEVPLIYFAVTAGISLVFFSALWPWLARSSERWIRTMLKPLAWGVAVATALELVGIGVFVLWPPISGPAAPPTVAPPSGAPNIVFITLDTVRADHLSSYGYSRPTTPNIDRFARTGVLFENAIAPTSWTLASHASMFTGLLPQQHGADWAVPLSSTPWTLAEILRSRGYETAGFVANNLYLEKGWGIAQGFETYDDYRSSIVKNLSQTFVGNAIVQPLYQSVSSYDWMYRRNAAHLNQMVFGWFRHRSKRPFFLFINYFDTHHPYITSEPYNHRFGRASMALTRNLFITQETIEGTTHYSEAERNSLIASYDNCLAYLDHNVGNLLNFLHRSPEWANTIVIITSDHGEEFGGHGSYDHGRNLYRGLLHVPLIIAGPGVPRDIRLSHLVATRQLFSTVLDLAGGGKTPFTRTSLARFWNPSYKPAPFDNTVVSELVPLFDADAKHPMICLTTPEYQFIEHRGGRQELYDWVADPQEQNNLAAAPADKATRQNLQNRLIGLVSDATGPWRGPNYLLALGRVQSPTRRSLLFPQPVQPGNPQNQFRIGMAQAYFKPQASVPIRPTRSQREIIQSLPYQ